MVFQKTIMSDLPGRHIKVHAETGDLDFITAGKIAKKKAKELCADPMLLSWFQGKTGKSYPNLECGRDDKPAWILYAESRNGDITIDINDGDFIFIFLCVK